MSSLTFKQLIYTSTAKGKNHWAKIVERARKKENDMVIVENRWEDVPHYTKKGELLTPEQYKKITINKFGLKFFKQTEENLFLGSSETLIAGDVLQDIELRAEQIETVNRYIPFLEVFKKPNKNDTYIITADTAKDGTDTFSLNVTNVSKFPFEQVAWADMQVDYVIMPEYLDTLGKVYNNALIIIENNEGSGQSISDTLWGVYEYENLYRDKNINNKVGFKKYTGFRTTPKSRGLILKLLKLFTEENKLIINSSETLKQLFTFTLNKSGKYIAESGYKDDSVMSMAILFAPFMENKRFDDYKLFVKELKTEDSIIETQHFISTFDVGMADDGVYDERAIQLENFRKEASNDLDDDYSFDFENVNIN